MLERHSQLAAHNPNQTDAHRFVPAYGTRTFRPHFHSSVTSEIFMPRYFFDVKNGHRLIDPAGLECRNDQEATALAVIIAQQIASDAPRADGRHIAVLNSEREEVATVPIHSDMNTIIMNEEEASEEP
jgi:hypothetical protein